MSAASGLAVVDGHVVVVADDTHHLGVFAGGSTTGGRSLRVIAGDLPDDPIERKRQKPDFEALTTIPPSSAFPNGALLALGSGSTPSREVAVLIELEPGGALSHRVHERTLSALYDPLRDRLSDLNIEGAFIFAGDLVLLSRANGSSSDNHIARYALDGLLPWLSGASTAEVASDSVTPFRVGEIDGVPLGLTDGAPHPNGGWVFSAAAEDTPDSYNDGTLAGAAVGHVSAEGELMFLARLEPNAKVEGIAASVEANHVTLTMVTDGDDPTLPALLLTATLPG